MPEQKPECPLYNPLNCKDYHHPTLCALVREDGVCRKKKKPAPKSPPKNETTDTETTDKPETA